MNKYFYYNYLSVSFANLLVFVPYILIQHRYEGAVMAIGISFVIGFLLLYIFTRVTAAYPGKDLISIIGATRQTWFIYTIVLLKGIVAIMSSLLVIGGYTIIVSRYLNPHSNLKMLLITVLIVVGYAATRKLLTIAYITEFMMVITIPFIIFIMYKTFTNPIFTWDSVLAVAQHAKQMPNLLTLSAAAFFYCGITNLSLYTLIKDKPLKFKYSWPAPIVGLAIAIITIVVPIGLMGTETSSEYLYVWTVASDATEIPFGFIERLMFIFMFVLLNIAISYTVSTLSQVLQIGKQMMLKLKKQMNSTFSKLYPYILYSIIATIIFFCLIMNNDFLFEQIAKWYLVIHFILEVMFIVTLCILVMWKGKGKRHEAKKLP